LLEEDYFPCLRDFPSSHSEHYEEVCKNREVASESEGPNLQKKWSSGLWWKRETNTATLDFWDYFLRHSLQFSSPACSLNPKKVSKRNIGFF